MMQNINNRNDFVKMLKQKRVMAELTLHQLSVASGVSASHLGRIERGERYPSARILRKLAKPLGFEESELFTLADYMTPPTEVEELPGRLDPYVAKVLSEEPVEIQRTVIGIITILKSMTKGSSNIEFREYTHRKYPELDEDIITMIEDILEHPPKDTEKS